MAGCGAYLGGLALLRATLRFAPWWPRLLAAAVLLATIPVGTAAGIGYQLAVIAAVVAVLLLAERRLAG